VVSHSTPPPGSQDFSLQLDSVILLLLARFSAKLGSSRLSLFVSWIWSCSEAACLSGSVNMDRSILTLRLDGDKLSENSKSRPILNTKIGGDKILSELIEEIDFLALGLPEAAILSGTPNASVLIGSFFCPCLDKSGEHRFWILFCRRTEC
jgi:hypothetical protein